MVPLDRSTQGRGTAATGPNSASATKSPVSPQTAKPFGLNVAAFENLRAGRSRIYHELSNLLKGNSDRGCSNVFTHRWEAVTTVK